MRRRPLLVLAALAALVLLGGASGSLAGEPPNQNDPCSKDGRDTCGTLGVGFYKDYRYGIRWFGDYKGVVARQVHAFCIDLRWWYPSPAYRYREVTAASVKNRDGETVPLANLERIAYAISTFGQTTNPNQQAAVALYVHAQMGDGRPGEVAGDAIGPAVAAINARVAEAAALYHGPYRVDVQLAGQVAIGEKATATIRVLAASGKPLPNLAVALTARNASAPAQVKTNAAGAATVELTPTDAGQVKLTATATVAAALPTIFAATTSPAAQNGQRVATAPAEKVSDTATASASKTVLNVTTTATPSAMLAGEESTDRVRLTGALPSYREKVAVKIFGPFATADAIRCEGKPAITDSFSVAGPGVYTTSGAKIERLGWYTYQLVFPSDANHAGLTTPCGVENEGFRVESQPVVRTIVSEQLVPPGTAITDQVLVEGLSGQGVTIQAALYGPYSSKDAITCAGDPLWTGAIEADADGTFTTAPVKVSVPGFYTYREYIPATGFARETLTDCAEDAETAIVSGTPQLKTEVSDEQVVPGTRITDRVVVTGLGALHARVDVDLFGPFQTRAAISCAGEPAWHGSFIAKGDGTYRTAPVRLDVAGYYTYREAIQPAANFEGATTKCADTAETSLAQPAPAVTTLVSAEIVRQGSVVRDRIRVGGLGKTEAAIDVQLFGPFALRAKVRCAGKPYWQGRVTAQGDGVLQSPPVKIAKAGFYTFRERFVGTKLLPATETECALVAETSLGAPRITTGRLEVTKLVPGPGVGAATPTRVKIESLGIDAPVSPVGIDVSAGELGVPPDIHRLGRWRDGSAPGAKTGAVLIAGHVDSKTAGAGAFFNLKKAKAGDRIQVLTSGGKTATYKVVSIRNYLKANLPLDVWSTHGRPRLVLVTCGGPFIQAEGHYRDNIVVVAVPA